MLQQRRSMMPVGALALALACLLFPRIASAQFDAATVLGAVIDATGARVPGATVTLKNAETGIVSTAVTDSEGNYQFLNVRIGTYSVRAELQGFSAAIAEKFAVTVNARQRVDLTMKVGDIGETVVVTGAARLLESESSDRGQVIGREQIVNLPLNGRAYADLALLSPGVRKSSISDSRDGSFNVNGLRSSLNNFILDGVDNNSYGTSNQGFSNQVVQVSPDAVEEFKVQTNNFSAEFGRAGGAVINATFRSGTNQFHGTRLGVQSQHVVERDWLLQAVLRRQAVAQPQPVRRRLRRPDRQGPRVLLRQLRGLPAGAAHRHLRQHSDDGAAAGGDGEAGPESTDRRGLRRRHRPAVGDHRRSPARCWPACRRRRGRASRTTSTACRDGRTTTTSSTSSSISRSTRRRAPLSASAIAMRTTSSRLPSRARRAARRTRSSTS